MIGRRRLKHGQCPARQVGGGLRLRWHRAEVIREAIARELGDNAVFIQTDVTKEEEVKYSHGRNLWNIVA